MLGREQRHETNTVSPGHLVTQALDARDAALVDTGLIGQQADALAAHQRDTVGEQHADARVHGRYPALPVAGAAAQAMPISATTGIAQAPIHLERSPQCIVAVLAY